MWSNHCSSLRLMSVFGDVTRHKVMVHTSIIELSNLHLSCHTARTQLVIDLFRKHDVKHISASAVSEHLPPASV